MNNRLLLKTAVLASPKPTYFLSANHHIAITDDGQGVAAQLAKKLMNLRYQASVVTTLPATADVVILLDGLKKFNSDSEAIAVNQAAFLHAQTIAPRFTQKGGIFIIAQQTGGQFGLTLNAPHQAWSGGLAGLAKTASIEWPHATCRVIDLNCHHLTAEKIAQQLLDEILTGESTIECGLTQQHERVTLQTQAQALTMLPVQPLLKPQAVVVVSGGARGITAACVIALAQQVPAHFVLLGRTSLQDEPLHYQRCQTESELKQVVFAEAQTQAQKLTPAQIAQQVAQVFAVREIKHTLEALAAAGAPAKYFNVDILNPEELNHMLQNVRQQWGKITGIIHGAGILVDKLIAQQTSEQFKRVFATKVEGLANLLKLTREDPLELICLFSSVAGRFGNVGQVAYSMANEVLNKVAQYEQIQRKNCLVKALNWGPWDVGMVTPELKKIFQQRGIVILSLNEGVQLFVRELAEKNPAAVEVIFGGELNPQKDNCNYSINAKSHAYLLDHIIDGKLVLPVCLVLEWFYRSIKQKFPAYPVVACEDFKVLKGVQLARELPETVTFSVQFERLQPTENLFCIPVKLYDQANKLCYSANMLVQDHATKKAIPAISAAIAPTTQTWPFSLATVYASPRDAGILFHGPHFQAVEKLEMYSELGGSGWLTGLVAKQWPAEPWEVDVLALDAALQFLLIWGFARLQKKTLPMKLGKVIKYADTLSTGKLYCEFRSKKCDVYGLVADIILWDQAQKKYMELIDVEIFVVNVPVIS